MEGFLSPRRSSSSSSIPPRPLKVAGSEAIAAAVGVVPADGSCYWTRPEAWDRKEVLKKKKGDGKS
jgi:hypothetical protein